MYFNRLLTVAMLAIVTLNFGCGLNTGEKTAPRKPPTYSGDNFLCVGKIPEYFDKYVNDQMSEKEITSFIQCIQKAFTTFAQLTRGRDETIYAPNEIRSFLHDFFLGKRRITDDLLAQVMLIKRAVIGGSGDHITRAELYQAVEALEDLRKEAIRIKPYLKVLNPTLAEKEDPARLGVRLAEAKDVLRQTIQVLQQRMQKHKCDYPLADLRVFLLEARAFVGWEKHFGGKAVPVDNWISFLKIFRELTVAPADPNVVSNQDWAPMLLSFSDWYVAYLQYRVGVKDRPVFEGAGLQNTVHLGRELFTLLEKNVSMQEEGTVPFSKIVELTNALHGLRWVPKLRAASLQNSLRAIIVRVLGNPDKLPNDRVDEGLTLKSISRARDIFYQWSYVQMNLERTRKPAVKFAATGVVPNLQVRPILNRDVRAQLESIGNSDWDEFLKIEELMHPLFPDGKYRVQLMPHNEQKPYKTKHEFQNLSMMNLMRLITTIIFRGYANGNGGRLNFNSGLTSEEMQKFFEDFREAGIDLAFVDRRNSNTGTRAFIEGNLFNYSSDGLSPDEKGNPPRLNFLESMEMFSFLWSGGKMAEDAYALMAKDCEKGVLDDVRRPKLKRRCVEESLPAVLDQLLESMPGLRQFLRLSPVKVKADYISGLLGTVYSPKHSDPAWVEMSELSMLLVVLHYAEAVLTKYDVNRDGALTNSEVDEAAKVFLGYIKKFTKEQMDKSWMLRMMKDYVGISLPEFMQRYLAHGAFAYILAYREIPVGMWDVLWVPGLEKSLNLNRGELSSVFRVIISKLLETPKVDAVTIAPSPGQKDAQNAACQDFMRYRMSNRMTGLLTGPPVLQIIPPSCRAFVHFR